jgi:16S rRNA (adenine1518-N6/adenine1519-N6)-dimethyltransferase
MSQEQGCTTMTRDLPSAPDPTSAAQLRQLFRDHEFHPNRSLGQTFLVDANIVAKVIAAAELTGQEAVLEIGAGAGAVTRALARAAGRVVAIEVDPKLVAILGETLGEAAEVVQADVLAVEWRALLGPPQSLAGRGGRWRVVANLPYAITGPALFSLTEARGWFDRLVVMVQREVAERLTAPPGSRARGMLSVLLQAFFDVSKVMVVSRNCFWPRPKVDSEILALTVSRQVLVPTSLEASFRQVVRAAFASRRKTLANALSHAIELGLSKGEAVDLLRGCRIEPNRRAETLTQQDFLRLTETYSSRRQDGDA